MRITLRALLVLLCLFFITALWIILNYWTLLHLRKLRAKDVTDLLCVSPTWKWQSRDSKLHIYWMNFRMKPLVLVLKRLTFYWGDRHKQMIAMHHEKVYDRDMYTDRWDYWRSNCSSNFQWIWEDLTEEMMLELDLEEWIAFVSR